MGNPEASLGLRQRAEEIARAAAANATESPLPEETRRTLHELRVHQLELEMQNEELHRTQEELGVSRARYFDLFNMAPVGYGTIAENGLILEINLTATLLLGAARGALIHQPLSRFILPEDQETFYRERKALLETGEPRACEVRMVKKDGTQFWAHLAAALARDPHGQPAWRVVLSDITERKLHEEELRLARAILEAAMDQSNAGIAIADAPDGAMRYVNDEGLRILGGNRQTLVTGVRIEQYAASWRLLDLEGRPLDPDEVPLTRAIRFGETCRRECLIRRARDDDRFVVANASPITNDPGKVVAGIMVFMDITDHKRAEEERAKLEAQNRQLQKAESLGRMAGAIAHHFNNKLQAVMGNLELALKDLPQNGEPVEAVTEAMRAARQAAEVSGVMLTYLGHTGAQRDPLDLAAVCFEHLPMLRAAMPKIVVMEIDLPSPGPTIDANRNQMRQVLTNLMTNAWESTGDAAGGIRLAVKHVSATEVPATHRFPGDWQPHDPSYACLEVADAGGGIPAQDLEKIFDPFFSSKLTGRGMGLAVVLGIVRAHHGVITVASEPGRGSVFRVVLPLSAKAIECLKPSSRSV